MEYWRSPLNATPVMPTPSFADKAAAYLLSAEMRRIATRPAEQSSTGIGYRMAQKRSGLLEAARKFGGS
jgi:hypothetical protein